MRLFQTGTWDRNWGHTWILTETGKGTHPERGSPDCKGTTKRKQGQSASSKMRNRKKQRSLVGSLKPSGRYRGESVVPCL